MCDFVLPSAQQFLDKIASEKTLSTSSFQKIKWFMVAVFGSARILGAYDHNSLNPFKDVKLPKNRRPKQAGRFATLENVVNMLAKLSDVDPVATRVVALAAFSGLRNRKFKVLNGKTCMTARFMFDVQRGARRRSSKALRPNPARVLCPSFRCWQSILKLTAMVMRTTVMFS